MKKNMRKEIRIGVLIFAVYNIIYLITKVIDTEIVVLHFCLGGLAGLAFVEIIIGLLPESIYFKIKNFKKKIPFLFTRE